MSTMTIIETKAEELRDDLTELEEAASYSLADAIREGSSVVEHCQTGWSNDQGQLCVLSTAAVALKARRMM